MTIELFKFMFGTVTDTLAPPHQFTATWSPKRPETAGAFRESWQLKINDPASQRGLWIGMGILLSANGFRRVADVWAVSFHRQASKEVSKIAVRQSHDLSAFSTTADEIHVADSVLSEHASKGTVHSKGQTIQWDLKLAPRHELRYELIPPSVRKAGLTRNTVATVQADALFSGTIQVNDEKFTLNEAPGMLSHSSGPRAGHSWVWGHCNSFSNEQGLQVPFVFEGITARSRVWGIPSPRLSSFHFVYQDRNYAFNSLRDAIRLRSQNSLTEWTFQAERGDLVFRGSCTAEHKDFAGLTFEDTNGSLIHRSRTDLAEMVVHVYRKGKLETSLHSNGNAAFEIASRAKNPYVPTIL